MLITLLIPALAVSQNATAELRVVPALDLEKYVGVWFEIARLPNRFQKDCLSDVTATYSLLADGDIKVVNRCHKEGDVFTEAEGRARLASREGPNSKLEVRFAPAWLSFLPFVWGNYWIIDLDDDYSYAVIGEPDREYLWVLARSPQMDEDLLTLILERARQQGYDTSALVRTKHTQ
jgi:apolipoprotein D and lipocalin family protein